MAHQDYVSRKNSKKRDPYQKSKPVPTQTFSLKFKLLLLVTLASLAAFAYFLWTIKDNQPNNVVTSKQTTQQTSSEHTPLPEFQDDGFDFMEDLKHKEVEPGQYEVTNKGPYLMQCGSFRSRSQAEELKANIAFTGISSQIRKTNGKNGIWYKVVLGPYERKRLAESDKHKLKNNKINYCQIWLWR